MKNQIHLKFLRTSMVAALFGMTVAANAADDLQGWTYNGHLDFYYVFDFGTPGMNSGVNFRQFDVNNNQFSFAVLEVDVARKPNAKEPFGITANFVVGNNADIAASFDPDGGSSKMVQQLYVTYAIPRSDATIDLGKFSSWIGYEGIDSSTNDNYSRSFLYTLGQPMYHAGLRGTATVSKNVTGSLYYRLYTLHSNDYYCQLLRGRRRQRWSKWNRLYEPRRSNRKPWRSCFDPSIDEEHQTGAECGLRRCQWVRWYFWRQMERYCRIPEGPILG